MDNSSQVPIRKNSSAQTAPKQSKKKMKLGLPISLIVGLLIVLGVGYFGYTRLTPNPMNSIVTNEYQALFLTNGQAYFGKITAINSNYVKMTNIYYLQAGQAAVQPKSTSTTQSSLSLIKLGKEIHGPEDQMFVARSQVLFWENLKSDSQVVTAIMKNQK